LSSPTCQATRLSETETWIRNFEATTAGFCTEQRVSGHGHVFSWDKLFAFVETNKLQRVVQRGKTAANTHRAHIVVVVVVVVVVVAVVVVVVSVIVVGVDVVS